MTASEQPATQAADDMSDHVATPPAVVNPFGRPDGMPGPGDRIGRFRLLDHLGEGGIGVVYRAEDTSSGDIVAIKVLRPSSADSYVLRKRFAKEAQLLASVVHPCVTRLIESDVHDGLAYMAMEYVPGESLGGLLRHDNKLQETVALGLIADAARGLAAVHELGMIHRDIKPDNILLTAADPGGPRAKVTDFGLARLLVQSDSQQITRAGVWVGTPLYMAPEQFGRGTLDARADVYSLGATLFHMLTGRPPFPIESLAELAGAVVGAPAPEVDRVNPDVSAATAALVARCLQKSPDARPFDAGALLLDIERLLGGEALGFAQHPRLPEGTPHAVRYVHEWQLAAPPSRLWPYVSNTERLNRAAGLPAVEYTLRQDPQMGVRRFAAARVSGLAMEWQEHPFEWVEGRRMGVLREFSKGPFVWFVSIVELIPRADGGTTLRQILMAEPRGLLGRVAARLELGLKAPRSLGAVYRRVDALVASVDTPNRTDDAFEPPTKLTTTGRARLRAGLEQLSHAGVPAPVIEAFGQYLASASDQDVARVRPISLARRLSIDESATIDCCLRAVAAGLLELRWDVICPLCRLPSGRKNTLGELRDHESCPSCVAEFAPHFAETVEMVFAVHPAVRGAELRTYCAGGPAHSPHVVAQVRLQHGERIDLDLALSPGRYRIRGPQLPWMVEFAVESSATQRRGHVRVTTGGAAELPALAAGAQSLTFENDLDHDVIVRIERSAARADAVTAARAAALPAFRELFPGELLRPEQLVPASAVTLLAVQVIGMSLFEEQFGEPAGFRRLQSAFRAIDAAVRTECGATIKTMDDTLVAAFTDPVAAVRAALALHERASADEAGVVQLRAAVHHGMALIATLSDRLDYFGQTPRIVNRLLEAAEPGSLLLSSTVADDAAVQRVLRGRAVRLMHVGHGRRGELFAHRVALEGPGPDSQMSSAARTLPALPVIRERLSGTPLR